MTLSQEKTDRQKYRETQRRLKNKLIDNPSNKEAEFNRGILCAMSIVKEIYGLPERSDYNE